MLQSRFGAPEHQCSWFLKKIKKYFYISKNYKIYSLNTYTCFEYLCEVLVEIALYFELQKKLWLRIDSNFVRNLSFLYSSKYTIFSSEISTVRSECLDVCAYLLSDFLESLKYAFQKPRAQVLICQKHFPCWCSIIDCPRFPPIYVGYFKK
jgi:hypothetical protein